MAPTGYWHRFEKQRVSRRRVLAGTGIGAASLIVAAACGSAGGATKTPSANSTSGPGAAVGAAPPAGPGKRGGRYKGVNLGAWGTIDPIVSVGNATGIMPRFYNTLISRSNVDPKFIFYDMATSYEQPDEVTYVFHMRPGVKIAPNSLGIPERDMDSQDAVRYFDRIKAQPDAIARKFTEPWVDSYSATADTFTFTTKGPYAYTLSTIGRALGGCIPPRETFDKNIDIKSAEAGAGPFMIRGGTFQESGAVTLDRNPNYYRKDQATGLQLPFWDGIDVALVADVQARKTGFLSKQLYDYAAQDAAEAKEIVQQSGDTYLVRSPTFTFVSWTMNVNKAPWNDDRIRHAAQHALNRQQFVDLIVGNGEGHPDGLVHWPTGPYAFTDAELNQDSRQSYDPKKSRDLIKAATGSDTIKVKIVYPVSDIEFHNKHLPIFLQQVKNAGFDVNQDAKDFTSWLGDYTDNKYDASFSLNQIYETPEIALDWQHSLGPAGVKGEFSEGVGKLHPEVDDAIMYSKKATSLDELVTRIKAAQDVAYKVGPSFLPIMSWYTYTNYWNFVRNVHVLGDMGAFLSDVWLAV